MTDISKLGEFGLIHHLTDNIKTKNESTIKGVGDDCAVLHYPDSEVLVTTDCLWRAYTSTSLTSTCSTSDISRLWSTSATYSP